MYERIMQQHACLHSVCAAHLYYQSVLVLGDGIVGWLSLPPLWTCCCCCGWLDSPVERFALCGTRSVYMVFGFYLAVLGVDYSAGSSGFVKWPLVAQ
jgi:hypothetical protein